MRLKQIKRSSAILLACLLLFGAVLPVAPAFRILAQAATSEGGFQYIADTTKKTVQITGYSGSALTITIPAEIAGYPVTSIKADAFKNHGSLLSVTLPDSVTLIGSEAFANCLLLSTLKLGKGLATIGAKAFANCSMLTSVSIPASTTSIGAQAFSGCKALSSISVDSGNPVYVTKDGVLMDRIGTTLYLYPPAKQGATYTAPSVATIDNYAFSGAKNLTSVILPDTVISLGKGAFKDCTALEQVALSVKLSKIDDEMFSGCTKLTAIGFPNAVKTIGESAFKNCTSIPALTIPDTVTTIGENAFAGCTGMKSVFVGKGLTAITGAAFSGCSGITEFKAADGATFSAQDGVLFNKDGTRLVAYPAGSSAKEYTIGDKVNTLGANAFDSCKNLQKLTIPKTVKTFVKPVVRNCPSLTIYVESGSDAENHFKVNTDGFATLKIGSETPGDVNGSGTVDNADVILLRRSVAGWKNITIQKDAADVNKDGKVDNADVILLRRFVAGWKNVTLK